MENELGIIFEFMVRGGVILKVILSPLFVECILEESVNVKCKQKEKMFGLEWEFC